MVVVVVSVLPFVFRSSLCLVFSFFLFRVIFYNSIKNLKFGNNILTFLPKFFFF